MSADAEFSSSAARSGGVGESSGGDGGGSRGGDGGGSRGEGGVTLSLSDLVSSRPR